jgi:hypothetical protein
MQAASFQGPHQEKAMTQNMKSRVLQTIRKFERQATIDKENNTQNAHKATTEWDVLHLINSAIADGEGGMYKGLGHVSFYVYVTDFSAVFSYFLAFCPLYTHRASSIQNYSIGFDDYYWTMQWAT